MPDSEKGGLLALDIATRTGFAFGPVPSVAPPTELEAAAGMPMAKPTSGTQRVAPVGCPLGETGVRFEVWLNELIDLAAPDMLIFEAPLLTTRHGNFDTARKLLGMAFMTEVVAEKRRIRRVWEATNQTVKKHFAGHGRAKKPEIMAECRRRGWDVADDNEADALALWDYAVHMLTARRRAA